MPWVGPAARSEARSSCRGTRKNSGRTRREGLSEQFCVTRTADWLAADDEGVENKSPKVMLVLFVSASSSLVDPRRPALVASLRVTTRDLGSGSGLTANRINQSNASGLYLAFNGRSCSPRPALCYRPLHAFFPICAIRKRLCSSPGRRTNRQNLGTCRRTSMFLLLLFLESIKTTHF